MKKSIIYEDHKWLFENDVLVTGDKKNKMLDDYIYDYIDLFCENGSIELIESSIYKKFILTNEDEVLEIVFYDRKENNGFDLYNFKLNSIECYLMQKLQQFENNNEGMTFIKI